MRQAFNPYLPAGEYVPDAEPHVFGDRVYIYGSHDRFGAPMFCINDYVCWSAPVDDLTDWRYEGVIFRKEQDSKNRFGLRLLFAPDVVQGDDGRYYMYYAFDFMGIMGVAVADSPTGPFQFHGHVHYADGTIWGRKEGDSFPFDPGALVDDDGRVFLFSGFYTPVPAVVTGLRKLGFEGGYVLELESDMTTIKTPEKLLFPKEGEGSFQGHEFFEASSIRKWDGHYYFVYSSRLNHELCYAVSDKPDSGYVYGGTLVSIGDVGLNGHADEKSASNYTGNTHGGMLRVGDDFYTFYHRQTNRSSYARQACAEHLDASQDERGIWHFNQAEVTSCGLNGGALAGRGTYEARIACNLWSADGAGRYDGSGVAKRLVAHPYFTQDAKDTDPDVTGRISVTQHIANMRDGATAGFKYFDFCGTAEMKLSLRLTVRAHCKDKAPGTAQGVMVVSSDTKGDGVLARVPIRLAGIEWKSTETVPMRSPNGVAPLYFTYKGDGVVDFLDFGIGHDTEGDAC